MSGHGEQTPQDLVELLDGKWDRHNSPKDLYARFARDRPQAYLEMVVHGLGSATKRVKNGCAELASLLSADRPELLYPHLDRFVDRLAAREPVLRWEAACTIGNLAVADTDERIPRLVPRLVLLLEAESIVLQGHAVRALAKIGRAYPREASGILEALFEAVAHFPGNRVGYIIEATELLLLHEELGGRIRDLVTPYLDSEVQSVARKARKVVRRMGS